MLVIEVLGKKRTETNSLDVYLEGLFHNLVLNSSLPFRNELRLKG